MATAGGGSAEFASKSARDPEQQDQLAQTHEHLITEIEESSEGHLSTALRFVSFCLLTVLEPRTPLPVEGLQCFLDISLGQLSFRVTSFFDGRNFVQVYTYTRLNAIVVFVDEVNKCVVYSKVLAVHICLLLFCVEQFGLQESDQCSIPVVRW